MAINLNIFELESSAYKTWRGKYNIIVVRKKKLMVAASTILQLTVAYTPSDPPSSTGFPCGARVFLLVVYILQPYPDVVMLLLCFALEHSFESIGSI